MTLTRRPIGKWLPELQVTLCTISAYNRESIDNLAAEFAGQAKVTIGDCIVGGDREAMVTSHGYSVWLDGQWACHGVPSLECAKAYVVGVRETEKEPA